LNGSSFVPDKAAHPGGIDVFKSAERLLDDLLPDGAFAEREAATAGVILDETDLPNGYKLTRSEETVDLSQKGIQERVAAPSPPRDAEHFDPFYRPWF
jgi:hypothetical protein